MTQAQVNTGYGTYGPQTTKAVLAFQKANGVDYSTGPGYWGQRTIAAAKTTSVAPPVAPASTTKPADDPSNRYNTQTGQLNPRYTGAAATPSTSPTPAPTGKVMVPYGSEQRESVGTFEGQPVIYDGGIYRVRVSGGWRQFESLQEAQEAGMVPYGGATTTSTAELDAILNNPNLAADQKAAIEAIFNAVQSNDADTASRLQEAMRAATEFSDPYFKAQIRLATDALSRGLSAKEGDLAFAESEKRAALEELRANTEASKGQLSFQHTQELQQLAQKYETDLSTVRDNMAASGFTSSTKRARAEQILGEQNTGLVESSNKQYGYQKGNLDRSLSATSVRTQAQIENLRRLAAEGKLNLFRSTEETVGSASLPTVGGLNPLGGVGGTIPRQQATDAFSSASSFVF